MIGGTESEVRVRATREKERAKTNKIINASATSFSA